MMQTGDGTGERQDNQCRAYFEDGFLIEDWLDLNMDDREYQVMSTSPASLEPTTLPGLTKLDKEYLAKCGTSAFIGISKSYEGVGPAWEQMRLRCWLNRLHLKGLVKVIPSSNSFLAAIFDTVQNRDTALLAMRKSRDFDEGQDGVVIAQPFGDIKVRTWTIAGGPMDTPQDIVRALSHELPIRGYSKFASTFSVSEIISHGYRDGNFAVRFEVSPPWLGKWITINAQQRLIKPQPPQICAFCQEQGHDLWDCENECDHALGSAKTKGTIGSCSNDDLRPAERDSDDMKTNENKAEAQIGDKRCHPGSRHKKSKAGSR